MTRFRAKDGGRGSVAMAVAVALLVVAGVAPAVAQGGAGPGSGGGPGAPMSLEPPGAGAPVLLAPGEPGDAGPVPTFGAVPPPASGGAPDLLAAPSGDLVVPPAGAIPYAPDAAPVAPKPLPPLTAPAEPLRALVANLHLAAQVTDDQPAIRAGLVWRVFQEKNDDEDRLQLVVTASGGDADLRLDPGSYLVHAAYGRAGATTRVTVVGDKLRKETLILNAGGLRLNALGVGDTQLPAAKLSFDIYAMDADQHGEPRALVLGAKPGTIIRLNADTYRVVGHYGDLNATVRAEIHVNPGKLTEATLYHKAAQITLKLVNVPGGEALTNTNWLVLTPSGDPISESVGAFPSIVLAEGDYALVAKNQDRIFTRTFSVQAGFDREIEVVADEASRAD